MELFFARLAESFDLPILLWIREHLQCAFGDVFFPLVTLLGEYGIVCIAAALVLILIPKTRKAGIAMGLSLLIGLLLCNLVVKPMCDRIRPFTYLLEHYGTDIPILTKKYTDGSFPSGHSVACVEVAVALTYYYKKWGIAALAAAAVVSFSRLYLFVHYPTDVIGGIVLGIIIGILSVFLTEKGYGIVEKRLKKNN